MQKLAIVLHTRVKKYGSSNKEVMPASPKTSQKRRKVRAKKGTVYFFLNKGSNMGALSFGDRSNRDRLFLPSSTGPWYADFMKTKHEWDMKFIKMNQSARQSFLETKGAVLIDTDDILNVFIYEYEFEESDTARRKKLEGAVRKLDF